MKKNQFKILLVLFLMGTLITSCKKKTNEDNNASTDATEARMHSDDNTSVEGETEAADDDINNTVSSSARFCGPNVFAPGTNQIPFDVDTSNTSNLPNRLILSYRGRGFGGMCKKRSGTIIVDLLNKPRWSDAGAVLKYTFQNFKVEDTCRGRSVTINGERYVTNVNGGNMAMLKNPNSGITQLIHKIRTGTNGLTAVFNDSLNNTKTANWNVCKKVTITAQGPQVNFKVDGDSTINGLSNTSGWGTTRNSRAYQTLITTAVNANTTCRLWRPTSGVVTHNVGSFTATSTYGLNGLGLSTGGNCATHFKIDWLTGNGISGSALIPYR